MTRIYISSTFLDLGIERDLVDKWLRKNGHEPVGSTGPDSRPVLSSCLADIETCQVYVLLQGHRYGYRPPENNPENLSITCLEFRHAGSNNIPRIVLQRTCIPEVSLSDIRNPDEMAKVTAFWEEVAGSEGARPAPFNDEASLIAALREGVDKELKRLGLAPGLAAVSDAFALASHALLSWPSTLPGGNWLPRPELAVLQHRIRDNNQSVTLLLGEPGCGKSALLARLGQEANAWGMPVLAIKADFLPDDILTQPTLGDYLGLPAPPLATIRTIAEAGPVLVLLDQLDALADLVVQHSARLRPLLELIHGLACLPNVHVVASCRAFEQHHDPSLRAIEAETLTMELPAWEAVDEVLKRRGIQAGEWNPDLRETLRSPHALDTFLSLLTETNEPGLLTSFQGMLQAQWEKQVVAIPGGRKTLLLDMARRMAEEERLFLPLAWFEDRYPTILELEAAGLIRRESGRLLFRHQTLYEFVRARGFLDQLGSLTQAVLAGQNSIRIRPQLWYALNHARQVAPERYQEELARLWSTDLRTHLRMLLIEFMGMQQEPLAGEVRLAFQNYDDPWFQRRFLNAVMGSRGWFLHLAKAHLPMLMAQPAETAALALPILERALAFAGEAVLAMVETYWISTPDKDDLTWRLLVMGNTANLDIAWVERVERIVRRTDLVHWAINDAASQVSESLPEHAPRLISAWLARQWKKARETSSLLVSQSSEDGDMTAAPSFRDRPATRLLESRGLHNLPAIAEAAPQAFVESIWPVFLEMLETIANEAHPFVVGYRETSLIGDDQDEDTGLRLERPLLSSLFLAMEGWAKIQPDTFLAFCHEHSDRDLLLVQRLLATGLAHCVAHAADEVLEFLCADPRRLVLGPYSDRHRDSKRLIQALAPRLAVSQLQRLELTLLGWHRYSHFPDDDASTRRERLRWDRQHRLRLLRALPREYMSPATLRRYDEEERAFPNLQDWDTRSSGAKWIGSPVSAGQMTKATDETVLDIFAELTDSTGWDHPRHSMQGGAIQAGRELARLAETDAARSVRLISQLRPGLNDGPVGEVLRALPKAGFDPRSFYELIEELCDKGFESDGFHQDACYAILEAVSEACPLPDRLLDRLESWLGNVDPDIEESEEEKPLEDSLLWGLGNMTSLPSGNYPILSAISQACFRAEPPRILRWLDCMERHLDRSESTRVWATLTWPYLYNLHMAERSRAQAFAERLLQTFPAILQRHEGILFMAHLQRWVDPEHARLWLGQMEILGEMSAQGAGEILMLRRAWFPEEAWPNQRIAEWLSATDAEYSPQRIGLAYSVAHLWSEPDHRQLAHAYLLQLMACQDPAVLKPLGAVHLSNSLFPDRATWEWLDTLCEHPALLLDQRTEYLIEHLETLVTADPARVARACNVLLDEVGVAMRDLSTHWYLSGEPLAAIALILQDMGEPHRAEGVALFERMLEFNLPQAREMTLSLDKRMSTDSTVSRPRRKRLRPR